MKLIRGLTMIVLFSALFGCSHQSEVVTKTLAVARNEVRMTSPPKASCRNKPNFEGMLRTLCY